MARSPPLPRQRGRPRRVDPGGRPGCARPAGRRSQLGRHDRGCAPAGRHPADEARPAGSAGRPARTDRPDGRGPVRAAVRHPARGHRAGAGRQPGLVGRRRGGQGRGARPARCRGRSSGPPRQRRLGRRPGGPARGRRGRSPGLGSSGATRQPAACCRTIACRRSKPCSVPSAWSPSSARRTPPNGRTRSRPPGRYSTPSTERRPSRIAIARR